MNKVNPLPLTVIAPYTSQPENSSTLFVSVKKVSTESMLHQTRHDTQMLPRYRVLHTRQGSYNLYNDKVSITEELYFSATSKSGTYLLNSSLLLWIALIFGRTTINFTRRKPGLERLYYSAVLNLSQGIVLSC